MCLKETIQGQTLECVSQDQLLSPVELNYPVSPSDLTLLVLVVAGIAPYQPMTLTKPIGWKGRLTQAQVSTVSCPLLLVFSRRVEQGEVRGGRCILGLLIVLLPIPQKGWKITLCSLRS